MMRLDAPELGFEATLDECIGGVTRDSEFKAKMEAARPELLQAGRSYLSAGSVGQLYTITPVDTATNVDPIVIGALVKSELINLYEYYFRNAEKASRATYDKLLNSAQEQCPFCGGIGTPRNLDHFLPKMHFPQFSILPQNLVPSCRDCNMDGKATSFATRAEDQLIQPYIDHDRFFTVQWIYADCVLDSTNLPTSIRYYTEPPDEWDGVHKDRVRKHFDEFELAKRYSVKAAQLLKTILAQMLDLEDLGLSRLTICATVLKPGIQNAPFINHWQRGMFQALQKYFQ